MKDPVVTHDGQVYERSGINEWFRSRRSQHGSGKSSASKASAFKREKQQLHRAQPKVVTGSLKALALTGQVCLCLHTLRVFLSLELELVRVCNLASVVYYLRPGQARPVRSTQAQCCRCKHFFPVLTDHKEDAILKNGWLHCRAKHECCKCKHFFSVLAFGSFALDL